MKRINIYLIGALLTMLLVNCEKTEIPAMLKEKNADEDDGERISYFNKTYFSSILNENQQPFSLEYAGINNDSTFVVQIFYLTTSDYKLHDFDFVWDEKLVADDEGKTWMNIEVYHKTNLENASTKVSDSVQVVIPDVLKFTPETISKLWLRFTNTTQKSNSVTVNYEKIKISENDNAPMDSVGTGVTILQDSVGTGGISNPGNNGGGGTIPNDSINSGGNYPGTGGTVPQDSVGINRTTPQDSIGTGGNINPGNNGSGGTIPNDSINSGGNNPGIGSTAPQDSVGINRTTPQDSIGTGGNTNPGSNGSGGTFPNDSINNGGNNPGTATGSAPQDSVQTGGTTVIDSTNSFGEVIHENYTLPAENILYFKKADIYPFVTIFIEPENLVMVCITQVARIKQNALTIEKLKQIT